MPAGRPSLKIDPGEVFKLASEGNKVTDIATLLDCSPDTIHNNFSAEIKKGRAEFKKSLRSAQMAAARAGQQSILIFLGKNYLGQKDSFEVTEGTAKQDLEKMNVDQLMEVVERAQAAISDIQEIISIKLMEERKKLESSTS